MIKAVNGFLCGKFSSGYSNFAPWLAQGGFYTEGSCN